MWNEKIKKELENLTVMRNRGVQFVSKAREESADHANDRRCEGAKTIGTNPPHDAGEIVERVHGRCMGAREKKSKIPDQRMRADRVHPLIKAGSPCVVFTLFVNRKEPVEIYPIFPIKTLSIERMKKGLVLFLPG